MRGIYLTQKLQKCPNSKKKRDSKLRKDPTKIIEFKKSRREILKEIIRAVQKTRKKIAGRTC